MAELNLPKDRPLTDAEVNQLGQAGYREGDTVPGYGTLTPFGTFATLADSTIKIPSVGGTTSSGTSGGYTGLREYTTSQGNQLLSYEDAKAKGLIGGASTSDLLGQLSGALNPYVAAEGSSSTRLAEIQAEETSRRAAAEAAIRGKFQQLQSEEQRRGVADVASRTGQLARVGGGGADSRFSSAAMGFIDAAKKASEKRMSDLQVQETIAMANLDVEMADRLREARYKEQDRLDKLEQERFNRLSSALGIQLQVQASDRAERDQALQEVKLPFDIVNNLLKIPAGVSFEYNGQTYKGLGTSGDVKQYEVDLVENGVRIKRVIGINEKTGEQVFSTKLGESATGSGTSSDKRYSASDIPPQIMIDLSADVQKVADGTATIADLYANYSDVSPAFINSLLTPTLYYGKSN